MRILNHFRRIRGQASVRARGVLRRRLVKQQPQPIRLERLFAPAVRSLEPRFVLNADAVINLDQLLITGDQAPDTVRLQVDSNGHLLLTDAAQQVIPIAGQLEPQGTPMDPAANGVSSIVFEMGAGDDILELDLPSGLNVSVLNGKGMDRTDFVSSDQGLPAANEIIVLSDTTTINAPIRAQSITVRSQGDVLVAADVQTIGGAIDLSSSQRLVISADLDSSPGADALTTLSGQSVEFFDSTLSTSGGLINVRGPVQITGELRIESDDPLVFRPGNVRFLGSIEAGAIGDAKLIIEGNNIVELRGPIGATTSTPGATDLSGISIDSREIVINSVGVTSGDIDLDANVVRLLGGELRTKQSGDVLISGTLSLPAGDVKIWSARDAVFATTVRGQTDTRDLSVTAVGDVTFGGRVQSVRDFTVSGATLGAPTRIAVSGDLDFASPLGIQIPTTSIASGGSQRYRNDVMFTANSSIDAPQVQFDGVIAVNDSITSEINAPIVGDDLIKTGAGTLVLSAVNTYSGTTRVNAGALRVEGTIQSGATVQVADTARLEGSGSIEADVITRSGSTLAPGDPTSLDAGTESLTVRSLSLASSSQFEVEISGTRRTDFDQIVVNENDAVDGTVMLGGALLDLSVNIDTSVATEFVVIANDGDDPISGKFRSLTTPSGSPSDTPRSLQEGDVVLDSVGPRMLPAVITYAGGDGNDVAIVSAGNVTVRSAGVTLITREGSNLEIRTGADLTEAENATPTIRPITAVNGNEVRILGSRDVNDLLVVDVDGFSTDQSRIKFDGTIRFVGGEDTNDQDELRIVDSSFEAFQSVDYTYSALQTGVISLSPTQDRPEYEILFSGVESIDQAVDTSHLSANYSSRDQRIAVNSDADTGQRTMLTATADGQRATSIVFSNPSQQLSVNGGNGNDQLLIDGFGTGGNGFNARLTLDGQRGDDRLLVRADLSLGDGDIRGDLTLSAENIRVFGNVDTTGGVVDGDVQMVGGTSVRLEAGSNVAVGDGSIRIDGNDGLVNFGAGRLRSDSAGNAITFENASRVILGDIVASRGELTLGVDNSVVVRTDQASGTSVVVDRLSGHIDGVMNLAGDANDLQSIGRVNAGTVTLIDSIGDLNVGSIDSDGNVTVSTVGALRLSDGAINAGNATTTLTAGSSILDLQDAETAPNIDSGRVFLVAGAGGIGRLAIPGQLGTPLDVMASISLSADTSGSGSDIHLANPFGGMPIGLIDAGTGNVNLTAQSIDDSNNNSVIDLIGTTLVMDAEVGIGGDQALEISSFAEVTAATNTGGIDLDWIADRPTVARQLSAGSGDIRLNQRGGQLMTIASIDARSGNIRVINEDGSINVAGDGSTDAIIAGDAGSIEMTAGGDTSDLIVNRGVRSLQGNILLTADRDVVFNPLGDVSSAQGSVTVTADQLSGAQGGRVLMADGALIDAGSGMIRIDADGGITLGGLSTTNATSGAVSLQTESGSVIDGGDQHRDIVTNVGRVTVRSAGGIGDRNPLETSISQFDSLVSGVGATNLIETDDIELRSVVTTDGSINVNAGGTITATHLTSTDPVADAVGGRNVTLVTTGRANDILVGRIDAGSSDVSLSASGAINDAAVDNVTDLIGARLSADSKNGIGSDRALELLAFMDLTATTDSGGIDFSLTATSETLMRQLTAGSGDIRLVQRGEQPMEVRSVSTGSGNVSIRNDASIVLAGDGSGNTIFAGDGGSIEVIAAGDESNLAVQSGLAAVGGNINLAAGADATVVENTDISSMGGTIILDAGGNATFGNNVNVSSGGGDIDVAADEDVSFEASANISSGGGNINFTADGDSTFADNAVISSDGGDISVVAHNEAILGAGITVLSGGGDVAVAADGNATFAANTVISSSGGSISVLADQQFGAGGSVVFMADGTRFDAGDGTIEIAADGNISLGGLLTTNAGEDAVKLTSESAAVVDGGDTDRDIVANAGRVTIRSVLGIGDQNPLETSIGKLDSNVSVIGATNINETDAIELQSLITNDGTIVVVAGGTITATKVVSVNALGNDDEGSFIGPDQRDIRLIARGPSSDIRVGSITTLPLTLGEPLLADALLQADDDILDTDQADDKQIQVDDLKLVARNQTGDQADAISVAVNVADVELLVEGASRGDAELREADSINLATSDRKDDAEVLRTSNGEIRVFAGENIRVPDVNAANEGPDRDGDREVIAGGDNGRINWLAGDTIDLANAVQMKSDQSTLGAVRMDASAIDLGAEIEITTGDDVGVARILSPRPQPICEVPPVGVVQPTVCVDASVAPAFFNAIRTNRLEQENANDGRATLTIDIGQTGELGLSVNIDWGAPTDRFQQIDGLSADLPQLVDDVATPDRPPVTLDDPLPKPVQVVGGAPVLTVTHVYLESDILDSTLNGRTSGTAPLEVRFSVRHHESIIVTGSNVSQGGGERESVIAGVVSATDNDIPQVQRDTFPQDTALNNNRLTHENGAGQFVIPNLSIPVAFFPVREVIPAFEEPEVFIAPETTLVVSPSTFEAVAVAASTSVSREEYFQIRVLSPDPDGEDLAPPARLPDDILDGDNLEQLFSRLPDGRYEIEYVLGDGNERSVLRVDLRNGKPIIPGEELDGGKLKLNPDDGEQPELEERPQPEENRKDQSNLDEVEATWRPPATVLPSAGVDAIASQRAVVRETDIVTDTDHAAAVTGTTLVATSRSVLQRRRNRVRRLSSAGRFAARVNQALP